MREDERRSLAATERQLEAEDPELARKLREDSVRGKVHLRITPLSAVLVAVAGLCVFLGAWFAAMQALALAGILVWWKRLSIQT